MVRSPVSLNMSTGPYSRSPQEATWPGQQQDVVQRKKQGRPTMRPLLRLMLLALAHQGIGMVAVGAGSSPVFKATTAAVGALLLPQAAQARINNDSVFMRMGENLNFIVYESEDQTAIKSLYYVEIYFLSRPNSDIDNGEVTVTATIPDRLTFYQTDDTTGREVRKTYNSNRVGWSPKQRSDLEAKTTRLTSPELGFAMYVKNNNRIEKDQSVPMTFNFSGGGYDGVTKTVTFTIKDRDYLEMSTDSLKVNEGSSASYTVRLRSQPAGGANATVTIGGASGSDVRVRPSSLTFTESNWDQNQTVTVEAPRGTGGSKVTLTHNVSVAGVNSGSTRGLVDVTVAAVPRVMISTEELVVEEGDTATYEVKLNTLPTGPVTVTLRSKDERIATVSAPLTFTTTNWNTFRTVTVTGVEDDDGNNQEDVTVTHAITGADDDYNDLPPVDLTVDVMDDDERGVAILESNRNAPLSELTVREGNTATYRVKLNTLPSGNVTITPRSDDTGAATVSAALTFSTTTWDTAQTVTVTGVEDDDGNNQEDVTVTYAITGADDDYNDLPPVNLTVNVTDDEEFGVTIVPVPPGPLVVTEGDTKNYTVKLDTEPSGNVTITPRSDDTGAATVSAALTFTATDWNTAQTVTVSGEQDDDGRDEEVPVTHAVTGADDDYNDLPPVDLTVNVTVEDNDTRGVILTPLTLAPPMTVTEGTSKALYTVKLNTLPTGPVTVTPSIIDTGAATVSPALTFTTTDWDTPQTVTVTGKQDDDGGEETVQVTHRASGADYDNVAAELTVNVTDKDTPDVTISGGPLTVTEGNTNTYTVVLDTEPVDDGTVTVIPRSNNTLAATVSFAAPGSSALTFTTSNWDTPQTVTVTGVKASNNSVTVSHTVSSADDADYNGLSASDLTVTVEGEDTAGVTILPSQLTISEVGSATYRVSLNAKPAGNVIIMVGYTSDKVTLSTAALLFEPSNWNTPQLVTVNGVDNTHVNRDGRAYVNHTVAGAAGYNGVEAKRVTVIVQDNETPPDQPTNLIARPGDSEVVLIWDDPNDATITKWQVQYKKGSAGGSWTGVGWKDITPSTIGTTKTVKVEELDNGEEYQFRILAKNEAGDSEPSKERGGTPVGVKNVIVPSPVRVGENARGNVIVQLVKSPILESPTDKVTVSVLSLSRRLNVLESPKILTLDQLNSNGGNVMIPIEARNDSEKVSPTADPITAELRVAVTGGGYSYSDKMSVEIVDNDTKNLVISRVDLSIKEGKSGSYAVSLSRKPPAGVMVTIAEEPSANNLTLISGPLTVSSPSRSLTLGFARDNWNVRQTVTVTTTPDSDDSDNKVTLTHTATGDGYDNVTDVSLTVTVVEPVEISPTGQSLGSGLAMMAAPAGVTVTPTELTVTEATGPANAATYTVVLDSQPTGGGVTVTPASADTQAAALSPNTALTFTDTNWSLPQTVTVLGVVDADNHHETVTVSHSVAGANYNNLRTDSVKVTVVDAEAAQQDAAQAAKAQAANLAATSRTMLGMATDVLGARTAKDRAMAGGDGGSIGEQAWGIVEHLLGSSGNEFSSDLDFEGIEDRLWSQSFQLVAPGTGQEDGSPSDAKGSWAFWGAGELRSYRGDAEDNISYSGNLKTAWLGVDHLFTDQWLAGLALSTSSGESDYSYRRTTGDTDGGKVTTRLTAFYPYGSLQLTERLRLWGLVGLGFGNQNHQPNDGGDSAEGKLRLQMGVIGFTQQLDIPGALQLALAGDVGLAKATTDWEAGSGLDDLDISLTRARLGVDTSFPLATHTTGHLSVKGRMDWGELEMGAAELLAGLHYHSGRFSASLQGLQVYAFDGDYTESGITAQLQFSTRPDGTGLAWTLQPSYGSDDGALALADGLALWSDEQLATLTGSDTQQRRQLALSSKMGYGIRLQDRDLLLTPFTELRFSKEGSRSLGLGLSMETTSWDVELTGSAEGSGGNPATGKVQLIFSTKL